MLNPPFDKTIYASFASNDLFSAPEAQVGDRDRYITNMASQFLMDKKTTSPFFLNLF